MRNLLRKKKCLIKINVFPKTEQEQKVICFILRNGKKKITKKSSITTKSSFMKLVSENFRKLITWFTLSVFILKPFLISFTESFIHKWHQRFILHMLNPSQTQTVTFTADPTALCCSPDALPFHCSELRLRSSPCNSELGTTSDFIHSSTMETLGAASHLLPWQHAVIISDNKHHYTTQPASRMTHKSPAMFQQNRHPFCSVTQWSSAN